MLVAVVTTAIIISLVKFENFNFMSDTSSNKNNNGMLAAGGLASAIAASACCILPLALSVLGISGAWMSNLRALDVYQPYFITLAIAAIAYGFYQVYFKTKKACADDEACARPLPNRLIKTGLWFGAVMVVLVLLFPTIFPFIEPYLP